MIYAVVASTLWMILVYSSHVLRVSREIDAGSWSILVAIFTMLTPALLALYGCHLLLEVPR